MTPTTYNDATDAAPTVQDVEGIHLLDLLIVAAKNQRLLLLGPLAAGTLGFAATYLIDPTFTSKTSFLPPQQQQSSAASALASLGALTGLAGTAAIKTPADQYAALMQSVTVEDRIVEKYGLMSAYNSKYHFQARKALEQNTRISIGKKDGLITVEVDAKSPQLAADMANQYVIELRRISAGLALTDAQERRVFFENQLKQTQVALTNAQRALQGSGFNPGALKAEPKAAAEGYATLKAQVTTSEVKLHTLQRNLTDTTPEIQQQLAQLGALRAQLAKLEKSGESQGDADFIGRYREYKYQEALFEMFSKQFEVAHLDESREGSLIQVIDAAAPAEYKSAPKRAFIAAGSYAASLILLTVYLFTRQFWIEAKRTPEVARKVKQLSAAWQRTGQSNP